MGRNRRITKSIPAFSLVFDNSNGPLCQEGNHFQVNELTKTSQNGPFLSPVYDELKSNVGFMERNVWFGLLLSAGLGLLWNIVAIFVALRNATLEDQKNERTALGPMGICLWSLLNGLAH
jgi:hypothetical protein